MTRSRSFNRSNRLNAKRRRRALRSAVPSLKDSFSGIEKAVVCFFSHAKGTHATSFDVCFTRYFNDSRRKQDG